MPGEERGGQEAMQGSERNKQPKKDGDLSTGSVKGKEEEKRWGRKSQSSSRLACLCAGPLGAKTPSRDNAAETMEDAENRGPAQLPGHLSRLIRLLRIPETSL